MPKGTMSVKKFHVEDDIYLVNLHPDYGCILKDYQFDDREIALSSEGLKKLVRIIQENLLGDQSEE